MDAVDLSTVATSSVWRCAVSAHRLAPAAGTGVLPFNRSPRSNPVALEADDLDALREEIPEWQQWLQPRRVNRRALNR